VRFQGPVDAKVSGGLGVDVVAVVREGLSNVARHAQASRVEVEIAVGDDLVVRVLDDGLGPEDCETPGHGTTNLQERARGHGGSCALHERDGGGAELEWRAPLT
jgi:signal transduction histidine kinase